MTNKFILKTQHQFTAFVESVFIISHKEICAGTQLCHVINMDKIREWKQFGAARRNKVFSLQLPFLDESKDSENEDESPGVASKLLNVGYEVVADGPTRVVRICIASDSNRQSGWQSNIRKPQMEVEVKVPLLFFSIVEPHKQVGISFAFFI